VLVRCSADEAIEEREYHQHCAEKSNCRGTPVGTINWASRDGERTLVAECLQYLEMKTQCTVNGEKRNESNVLERNFAGCGVLFSSL
jgi:hypothetical protein